MNRSKLAALSAGAMFLVATVLVPATAFAAGTGSLSVSPNVVNVSTGATFYVDIVTNASVDTSGASASVDFDETKLQIVSVTKGADWEDGGATSWVFPTASTIGSANSSGHLTAIAAFYTDGTSSQTASTNLVLARVTFFATATGTATISLPTSGTDAGGLLDGSAATYGSAVATSSTDATVNITAGGNPNAQVTADITGTVDAGYVALTCPTSVDVPLVRNVTNDRDFNCQIGSNVTWTLSAQDTNPDGNHGHMVDALQGPVAVLADALHLRANKQVDGTGQVTFDSDVNLEGAGLQAVAVGQANVNLPLTFQQFVRPSDKPGSYGMNVLFSLTSTF